MRFTHLEHLDSPVSRIVLGTAWFGTSIETDLAYELMDRYAACGGNMLDTAHMYANWVENGAGMSEKTIGQWLKRQGGVDMLIATKGADRGMNRKDIRDQLNESLDRLGVDRVAFYWLHRDDTKVPVGDILQWLNELKNEGRFAAFGCSNWRVPRIKAAATYARENHLQGFSASQISWSLALAKEDLTAGLSQVFMDEATLAFHRESELPVAAYSSQAGGFFAGKYDPDHPRGEGEPNANIIRLFGSERNYRKLAAAKALAAELGCTANQASLAWLLHQSFPACAIVGANSPDRVVDSCGAADVSLSPAQVAALTCE